MDALYTELVLSMLGNSFLFAEQEGNPVIDDSVCGVNFVSRPKFCRIEVWTKNADAYRKKLNEKGEIVEMSNKEKKDKLLQQDKAIRKMLGPQYGTSTDLSISFKGHESDEEYNRSQIEKKAMSQSPSGSSSSLGDGKRSAQDSPGAKGSPANEL